MKLSEDPERLIDLDDEGFQLGRQLYEAQVLLRDMEKGESIAPERGEEVCRRFCRLINLTGMLRAECYRIAEQSEQRLLAIQAALKEATR